MTTARDYKSMTMAEKYRQRPDDYVYASPEEWIRFVESIDLDCNFELTTDPPGGLDMCFSDGSKHRLVRPI
jgi:hypothetical protein